MATGSGVFSRLFGLGKNEENGKMSDCCGGIAIVPEDDEISDERTETPSSPQGSSGTKDVLVITGNCCNPGVKPLDDEATRVAQMVAEEADFEVQVRTMSATAVLNGALSESVVSDLVARQQQGRLRLPVLMIDGAYITDGRIDRGDVESGLGIGTQTSGDRRS